MERKNLSDEIFISSDPRPLQRTLRESLSKRLGYSLEDSDPCYLIGCSILPTLTQTLAGVDAGFKAGLLQFSTGSNLDAIGTSEGLERRTNSQKAQLTILLEVRNAGWITSDITWECSVICQMTFNTNREGAGNGTVDTGYSYSGNGVIPRSMLNTSLQVQYIPVTLTADFDGVGLVTFPLAITQDVNFSKVHENAKAAFVEDNAYVSRQGYSPETDDEFAQRIFNTRLARSAYGSRHWYLELLKSAYPDVTDIQTRINGDALEMYVLTDDETSSHGDDIRADIFVWIQEKRFVGDEIEILKPYPVGQESSSDTKSQIDLILTLSKSQAKESFEAVEAGASMILARFMSEVSKKLSSAFDFAEITARIKTAYPCLINVEYNFWEGTHDNSYGVYWRLDQVSISCIWID